MTFEFWVGFVASSLILLFGRSLVTLDTAIGFSIPLFIFIIFLTFRGIH